MKTLLNQISNPGDVAATAGSLNVQVVATSASGTRAALRAAQAMAAGLDARIVVVVP